MRQQCEICNRSIQDHLKRQHKHMCFACLTEKASQSGALSTFSLKQKPIKAPCAICDFEMTSNEMAPSPWGFICHQCRDLCESQSGVSWEAVRITAQKQWLVKANNRILGPLSTEEVENELRQNRIVGIDEISKPVGRWKMIRNEDDFRVVINEIKNRQSLRSDPHLESTDAGTITDADTEAVTDTIDLMDRPFARTDKILQGVKGVEEAQVVNEELNRSAGTATRDVLKTYGTTKDPRVQKQLKQVTTKKFRYALGIFAFAALVLTYSALQPNRVSETRMRSFQDVMDAALRSEKVGDQAKAFLLFNEARTIKPNDSEMLLHLAPMTLYYDRQALQAGRMFKQILDTERGANYQKAAYVGLGLVALETHELDEASQNFAKALTFDAEYMPAIANMGVVSFFKDDLASSENLTLKALEKGGSDGAIVINMAEIAMAGADRTDGKKKLKSAHEMMEAYLNVAKDYEQEVLIQDARVLTMLERHGQAEKKIEQFLDIDPESTDLHLRDWQVYRGRASWGLLVETLRKTVNILPSSPRLNGALGLAMYRGREKLDGAQSVEQALAQAPRDPLMMALAGWIEIKLGRRDAGVTNIRQAALMPENRFRLPHILQGRVCQEEKDWACAKRSWEIVLSMDARSVEALAGLAQAEWAVRNREAAVRWLRQGQAMDSNYLPLLSLAQEIQSASGGLAQ